MGARRVHSAEGCLEVHLVMLPALLASPINYDWARDWRDQKATPFGGLLQSNQISLNEGVIRRLHAQSDTGRWT